MVLDSAEKQVEHLVVDTTAFIQNAPLQDVAKKMYTVEEVVSEITNKRQLRRLCVLPYELEVKNVYPENIRVVADFAKKTGDFQCLSGTDIKVIALAYQMEKELVGTDHLRQEPIHQRTIKITTTKQKIDLKEDIAGFYVPGQENKILSAENPKEVTNEVLDEVKNSETGTVDEELKEKFKTLNCNDLEVNDNDNILQVVESKDEYESEEDESKSDEEENESDDDDSWITPSNVQMAKKSIRSEFMDEKHVKVACMTTDFAMQNVLRQMNLNVSALDGRMIKQLKTYILRCYTCFNTTSIMTKKFCPKCGNNTLKRVSCSVDENGKQQIHINARRPLTCKGKKYSMPTIKGGKHSRNPKVAEDQPMPDQRPTRLAKMKTNAMDDDYTAGFSPFVMKDVNSKSAQLRIRPGQEAKQWLGGNRGRPRN
ncbi:PREDICTED: RNA-binding protein NOB1 [Nicrophorus vespilloides]|uniref:RNA-binding protein NOB1 n=1 Tax=Nicrophorus vespilloides TaxID=110193 RepID=A0ABM1NHU9_NICVS|nr:PREDICTED: RNA-binding protein NOB1 [Nicrophorus vespilloides]